MKRVRFEAQLQEACERDTGVKLKSATVKAIWNVARWRNPKRTMLTNEGLSSLLAVQW